MMCQLYADADYCACVAQGMGRLAVLVLEGLPELEQVKRCHGCPALRAVSVISCANLQKLDLGGLRTLERLHIRGCGRLEGVAGVAELAALTRLVVADCRHLQALDRHVAAAQLTEPLGALCKVRLGPCSSCKAPAQHHIICA
jgi:hypothetical protein